MVCSMVCSCGCDWFGQITPDQFGRITLGNGFRCADRIGQVTFAQDFVIVGLLFAAPYLFDPTLALKGGCGAGDDIWVISATLRDSPPTGPHRARAFRVAK